MPSPMLRRRLAAPAAWCALALAALAVAAATPTTPPARLAQASPAEGDEDDPTRRVVGGYHPDAPIKSFALGLNRNKFAFCGAVVVGRRHLISAAHCVEGGFSEVVLNVLRYSSETSSADGNSRRIKVKKVKMHPAYDTETWENDVCVIELAEDVDSSLLAEKAILATGSYLAGVQAQASVEAWEAGAAPPTKGCGFGYTSEGGQASDKLMCVRCLPGLALDKVPVVEDPDHRENVLRRGPRRARHVQRRLGRAVVLQRPGVWAARRARGDLVGRGLRPGGQLRGVHPAERSEHDEFLVGRDP